MAVGSGTPYNIHVGNGVTTTFAYGFTVLEAADLAVTVDGVANSAYTIFGVGDSAGGAIVFTAPPANGAEIILRLSITLERLTDYQNNGDLLAPTLNADFDRLWQALLLQNDTGTRSIRVPFPETCADIPTADERASKILAFDASGNPVVIVGADTGSAAALDLSLRSTSSATEGAGQLGLYPLNYAARTVGAGITDNAVNFLWFCTDAQRTAIKAKTYADDLTAVWTTVATWANGRPIYLPAGGYKISAQTLAKAGQIVFGDGWGNSIVRGSDPTLHLFTVTADNVTFRDLELHGTATAATTSRFAIFTDTATPAKGLKVQGVKFSGQSAAHGFTNAIKYDDGCDGGTVEGCYVERLFGTASGFGYGVLCGNVKDARYWGNWFYGAAGRGRHAVYLSGGANGCVVAWNYAEAFVFDCITQFSQGIQPACTDNFIAYNRVVNGASIAAITSGAISIAGHSLRTKIIGNKISGSLSCGIKVEGTGFTDMKDTDIISNDVVGSAFVGIDLVSAVAGKLHDNYVKDSGSSSVGTYANVRFISDATTATSDWLCTGNRIPASAVSRAAFQANATAPVPTGLKFTGNQVGAGTVSAYEFAGTTNFPIDGRLQFSQSFNPASIANGASQSTTWTVNGAVAGDVVTVTHDQNSDGCSITGYVSAANTVTVNILNNSGGAKDIAAGTLYIDVYKRT